MAEHCCTCLYVEGGWSWKRDRRDGATMVFISIAIDKARSAIRKAEGEA